MSKQKLFVVMTAAFTALFALTAIAPVMSGGLALAQGSGPSSGAGLEAPDAAYALYGDLVNPMGSKPTLFQTNSGWDDGGWNFQEVYTNGIAVKINCLSGDECIGANIVGHAYGAWSHALAENPGATSYGIRGSTNGVGDNTAGVWGWAAGNGTSPNTAVGVKGTADSSGGTGVLGTAPKYGVRGYALGALSFGGFFTSTTGTGLRGSSQTGIGVYALSNSSYGLQAQSTSNHGILASSGSKDGVHGTSGTGYGVYGNGGKGGVYGEASSGSGVSGYGVSGSYGGYFSATTGIGLFAGSNGNHGLNAYSKNLYGVLASSDNSIAVRASSKADYALYATTDAGTIALRAIAPSKASGYYAGYFDGNVYIRGSYVATGTKSAMVYTSEGERLMYAEEATQNYFSDMGGATLKDGRAVVKIDPLFAQSVSLDSEYRVFITPNSAETLGLAVINKTATSFEVVELGQGKGNFTFDWRLSALRRGYEKDRMERAPAAAPALDDAAVLPK